MGPGKVYNYVWGIQLPSSQVPLVASRGVVASLLYYMISMCFTINISIFRAELLKQWINLPRASPFHTPPYSAAPLSPTTTMMDRTEEENAVNHEIATLLLNLASRTTEKHKEAVNNSVQVHNISRQDPDVAIDLSKSNNNNNINKTSSTIHNNKVSSSSVGITVSSQSPYTLFPLPTSPTTKSLSTSSPLTSPLTSLPTTLTSLPSSLTSLPPSYLLQNLLMGKIQQLETDNSSNNSDKITTTVTDSGLGGRLTANGSPLGLVNLKPHINGQNSSTIPLLAGQIVAQLNALLFSIHGLTDKAVESKVDGQLSAIFSRLQEIVTLVNITKQQQQQAAEEKLILNITSPVHQHALNGHIQQQQQQNEHKLVRQEQKPVQEEYHINSTAVNNKQKEMHHQHTNMEHQQTILEPQTTIKPIRLQPFTKEMLINNDSPSMLSRKTVISRDLTITSDGSSPPEAKRLKQASPDDCSSSTAPARKATKGGKGIRNRVFCGDCPGCLKNDDCGQCRYCRDKTKFGGQNRLRQKCLHRRCQMDTHRRPPPPSAAAVAAAAAVNVSCSAGIVSSTLVNSTTGEQATIYSGVDLARLASVAGDTFVEDTRDRSSPYSHMIGKF